VDTLVTGAADDEGFAVTRGHPHDPFRWFLPPFGVEVFERPDVVHLNLMRGAAQFAGVGQESLHEF